MIDRLIMAWRFLTRRCMGCGDWASRPYCGMCETTILRLSDAFDASNYIEVHGFSEDSADA